MHFGHRATPHEVALAGREAILRHLKYMPEMKAMATQYARQIDEFYRLPWETIWVTFEGGDLWWAQAETEVMMLGETETNGHCIRRTLAPWRNTDVNGQRLRMDSLSTRLTMVAGSQQTLCNVSDTAYLLRKIRGEEEPAVRHANEALAALEASAVALIAGLHQDDFETLIDLLLARGGWTRESPIGRVKKDFDLIATQFVTGERATVQVKSAADQKEFERYLALFDGAGAYDRLIFACHSPRGTLQPPPRKDVILWTGVHLARAVVRNGLFDWVV